MNPLDRARRQLREEGTEILVEIALREGIVTAEQLQEAQKQAGRTAYAVLVERGILTPDQVALLKTLRARGDLQNIAQSESAIPTEVMVARGDPSRIMGRYVLVNEAGRGGSGTVWRAWDGQLRRWVALKMPRDPISPTFRQRFLREARLAASLSHPNLVAVHDAGEFQSRPYLVMEFLTGRSVGPQDGIPGGVEILRKVAMAIGEAHRHGIIHRDLKPANILVDGAGEPHVVDFGLAWQDGSDFDLTRTGATVGTPLYMAPEQASGRKEWIGPATDVYALGAILYEVLTGRPPFLGATPIETLHKVTSQEPVPPRRLAPAIAPDLESICLKALEKEPRRRYASADEFAADLKRHQDGQPILAKPASWGTRSWKRLRRQPVAWSSGIAVAIVLSILSLVTIRSERRAARVDDQLTLEKFASELSNAYVELRLKTALPMRALEDHWHTQAGNPAAALAEVESITSAIEPRFPRTRLPRALRGLARVYAGRTEEGLAEIESAAVECGEDPFPDVIAAVVALSQYCAAADIPVTYAGHPLTLNRSEMIENSVMVLHRDRASKAVDRALARPVWSKLQYGREFERFIEGARCLAKRDYQKAGDILAALRDDPMLEGQACLLGGLARFLSSQYSSAIPLWTKPVGRGWGKPLYFTGVCRLIAQFELSKWSAEALAEIQAAIADLEEAGRRGIAHSYRDAALGSAWFLKGRILAKDGTGFEDAFDRADAFGLLLQESKNDPIFGFSIRSTFQIGAAEANREAGRSPIPRLDRALAILTEWIRKHGERSALLSRAHCLRLKGRAELSVAKDASESYRGALADFDQAAKMLPLDAEHMSERGNAHLGMALVLKRAGGDPDPEFDLALRDLEEALHQSPGNASHITNRGVLHMTRGHHLSDLKKDAKSEYETAIADFNRALEKEDIGYVFANRGSTWLRYGIGERDSGRDPLPALRRALSDLTRAIDLDPGNAEMLWTRGLCHYTILHYKPTPEDERHASLQCAVWDLSETIRLQPRHWEALRDRGNINMMCKHFEEGIRDIEASLEINPDQEGLRTKLEAWKTKYRK